MGGAADKWEAQYRFWSSFGLPAYEENSVPGGAALPYITYQAMGGGFGEPLFVTASVWTRSSSWLEADRKADEIESRIRAMLPAEYDGGMYRVYIGDTAFAQSMGDDSDDLVKRKILNVVFEFMQTKY